MSFSTILNPIKAKAMLDDLAFQFKISNKQKTTLWKRITQNQKN